MSKILRLDSEQKNSPNKAKIEETLKKGAVPKVWGSLNYFKFTSEFKSAKI